MGRRVSRRHLLPIGVLAFCTVVDLVSGPDQVLIGLLAMGPLVAAILLGRWATIGYGLAAVALAVVLGLQGDQYSAENVFAQSLRILGVVLSGVIAVVACTLRLRREAVLARLQAFADGTRKVIMRRRMRLSYLPRPMI